jgi:hypothetical protein
MDKQAIAKLTNEEIESRIQDKMWVIARLQKQVPSNQVFAWIDDAMVSLSLLLEEANYRRNDTAISSKALAKLLVEINRSINELTDFGTDKFVTSLAVDGAYSVINNHFNVTFGKIHALAVLQNYACDGRSELLLDRLYEAKKSALKAQAEIRQAQSTKGGAA